MKKEESVRFSSLLPSGRLEWGTDCGILAFHEPVVEAANSSRMRIQDVDITLDLSNLPLFKFDICKCSVCERLHRWSLIMTKFQADWLESTRLAP